MPVNKPGGVAMHDINIEMKGEEGKSNPPPAPGPTQRRQISKPGEDDEDAEEDFDGYDDEGKPFFTQIVNRYPKKIIWYFMVLAFASARAATPFAITMAYLSLIAHAVQIVGAFVNKPIVGFVGYGISCLMLTILYFIAMAHEKN